MFVCYDSDILFYTGLSIGLWIASAVGLGCAMFSFRKKSYSDQIEEMMFDHIVQQLRGINMAEAFEQEQEEESEEEEEEEQEELESDSESEQQEQEQEQEESEEANDADNEQEQEQDIEYVEETHTEYDDLPDLVEEPAPVEAPSDDTDIPPPSKRARRGRGRGRGRGNT